MQVVVAFAADDPVEFRRQSLAFAAGLNEMHAGSCDVMDIQGHDHFDTVERLADPTFPLTQRVLAMCARGLRE